MTNLLSLRIFSSGIHYLAYLNPVRDISLLRPHTSHEFPFADGGGVFAFWELVS